MVKISILAEGKKKKMKLSDKIKSNRDYSTFRDGVILFLIVFTSFTVVADISYISVPIFLTVVYLLLQIKRLISNQVKKKSK